MKIAIIPFALLFFLGLSHGQDSIDPTFSIIFYNVENLFDTEDDPLTMDEEFTPESEKKWNKEKYQKKLEDLSKVLISVYPDELPEIIGLAEVENCKVLEDLKSTAYLKKGNYEIVHSDGPDERGIDVALLYRKDAIKQVTYEHLPVSFPFDSIDVTRDILYVKGSAEDGKDFHFFVNHWSSRSGGMVESEPKRMQCAVTLRKKIDYVLCHESDPRIVIMGDFNDEPTNKSIMNILLATNKRKNIGTGDLFNLFYDRHNSGNVGSYNYKGTWNMLDQIIVSYNLINTKGLYSCNYQDGIIFSEDWMMYQNEDGQKVPSRTYGGPNYYGGISDHLPVSIRFRIK